MSKIKLVTHSGRFHADDAFATAVLTILFEKTGQEFELIRSRDPKEIEAGDIVYDNGTQYDPDKKIFDHHQEGGAGERENGVPYAAFGLIWKHYGKDLVKEFFDNENSVEWNSSGSDKMSDNEINEIHRLIDKRLVQPVDASDTGYEDYKSNKEDLESYVLDSIATTFNPTNDEGYEKSQELFMQVVEIFKKILTREILKSRVKIEDFRKVEEAYEKADDKRVIILDQGSSWKDVLVNKEEPLFVIFPTVDNDGFMIQAVNKAISGYETRKSFPENWRGKTGANLEKETGVEGSKFCHLAGFLCVTKTLDQAKEIVKIAVES